MPRHRSLVTALALISLGVVALGVSSAVAVEPDQVPVTQDDSITVWAGTSETPLNLLANDSDPDGEKLLICRFAEWQPDSPVDVEPLDDRRGGRVLIDVAPNAAGSYTYEYRVCDHSYLVPATLTVDVKPVGVTTVAKVPERPRMLRVTNPDQHEIVFIWWGRNTDDFYAVQLAAGGSRLVRAGASRIDWAAGFVDGDVEVSTGYGSMGGLTASRPAPALRAHGRVPSRLVDALVREREGSPAVSTAYDAVDPTTVAPPVTQGDDLRWWAGAAGRVNVLANDSDPQAQSLDVCRVDRSGRAVSAWTQLDNTGFTVETSEGASGTYTVTYYACNDARLTPGTVTVHLRQAKPVRVAAEGNGLRIVNPNPERVEITLDNQRWHPTWSTVRVAAHGVRHVQYRWAQVAWYAQIGHPRGFAGSGRLGLPG